MARQRERCGEAVVDTGARARPCVSFSRARDLANRHRTVSISRSTAVDRANSRLRPTGRASRLSPQRRNAETAESAEDISGNPQRRNAAFATTAETNWL